MNKKGFTLIELLAVIVILGIIMIVAVPNVLSVINKQEKNTYINDAKKLITMAKYKMSQDTDINYPVDGGVVYLEYDFINNGDIKSDSDGYEYDSNLSFVALSKKNGYVIYHAQLLSKNVDEYYGIGLTSEEDLGKDTSIQLVGNSDRMIKDTDAKEKYKKVFKSIYKTNQNPTSTQVQVCSKKGCHNYA